MKKPKKQKAQAEQKAQDNGQQAAPLSESDRLWQEIVSPLWQESARLARTRRAGMERWKARAIAAAQRGGSDAELADIDHGYEVERAQLVAVDFALERELRAAFAEWQRRVHAASAANATPPLPQPTPEEERRFLKGIEHARKADGVHCLAVLLAAHPAPRSMGHFRVDGANKLWNLDAGGKNQQFSLAAASPVKNKHYYRVNVWLGESEELGLTESPRRGQWVLTWWGLMVAQRLRDESLKAAATTASAKAPPR